MTDYILEDLLRVRSFREEDAQLVVQTRKHRYDDTCAKLEQCENELQSYVEFRIDKEYQLFESVRGQEISTRDLEEMKLAISLLRDRQVQLEEDVKGAENEKSDALHQLAAAQAERLTATRQKEKIVEHKRIWLEEFRKEQERLEETEAEEFLVRKTLATEEAGHADED